MLRVVEIGFGKEPNSILTGGLTVGGGIRVKLKEVGAKDVNGQSVDAFKSQEVVNDSQTLFKAIQGGMKLVNDSQT